jgi:cytochrome c2
VEQCCGLLSRSGLALQFEPQGIMCQDGTWSMKRAGGSVFRSCSCCPRGSAGTDEIGPFLRNHQHRGLGIA